jgi:hypothetical protein
MTITDAVRLEPSHVFRLHTLDADTGTGRAVVTPDVEHHRVVEVAERLDLVEQATDLHVDMLPEPGRDLHQPALKRTLRFGDVVPRRHPRIPGCQLSLRRDPSRFLGACEDAFAVGVPTVVELPGVLVGPLLHHMVGCVQAAGGPVHEEGLVRLERLVPVQPADSVVGKSSLRW